MIFFQSLVTRRVAQFLNANANLGTYGILLRSAAAEPAAAAARASAGWGPPVGSDRSQMSAPALCGRSPLPTFSTPFPLRFTAADLAGFAERDSGARWSHPAWGRRGRLELETDCENGAFGGLPRGARRYSTCKTRRNASFCSTRSYQSFEP